MRWAEKLWRSARASRPWGANTLYMSRNQQESFEEENGDTCNDQGEGLRDRSVRAHSSFHEWLGMENRFCGPEVSSMSVHLVAPVTLRPLSETGRQNSSSSESGCCRSGWGKLNLIWSSQLIHGGEIHTFLSNTESMRNGSRAVGVNQSSTRSPFPPLVWDALVHPTRLELEMTSKTAPSWRAC